MCGKDLRIYTTVQLTVPRLRLPVLSKLRVQGIGLRLKNSEC
jgi:hypothetical protein